MGASKEDGAISVTLIQFSECEMYTEYTPSVGTTDQCLREIVQYEAYREEYCVLFPTSYFVLQISVTTLNGRALKGTVRATLLDCNGAQKRRARDNLFQSIRHE